MSGQPEERTHVLHVSYGFGWGGMELVLSRLITELSDRGMRHTVLSLRGGDAMARYIPDDMEVVCLRARANDPRLPGRIAQQIRRIRPTVIHARNWGAWPDTAVGRLLTWPIVPLIFSFHGYGDETGASLRRRATARVLAKMTTHLFALSERSKQMLVSEWGWPESGVDVIPNGVDTERFRPSERPRSAGRLVVGSAGRLETIKNYTLLVRACADLVRSGVDLELHIAGTGSEQQPLLDLAGSLGLADRFRLPGYVDDMTRFLQSLDVFALSSDSEQHPNALNEAMACGLPCVATRVGGVEELLDGGRCGRIVPPGDTEGLTGALRDLLTDPESQRRHALAARQRVCKRYSLERMVEAYAAMYRQFSRKAT